MQSFTNNNHRVYSLSSETFLPEWMSSRERRKLLSQNPKLQRRIELLQGLGMPDICSGACVTKDGKYLLALGTYKPRLRCYEFSQNSLKFERGLDFEALKLISPLDDFSRLIILQRDRYVEFHTGSGQHYRTRVADDSRDFCLNERNADIYFVGKSANIHRLNIYQGQFMQPFLSPIPDLRCCAVNNDLQLLAVGTEMGSLQIWDCRDRNMVTHFSPDSSRQALTHLQFGKAMQYAVGSEAGLVSLFDLRAKKCYAQRDHRYGLPINNIEFLNNDQWVASSDKRGVRVWSEESGDTRLIVSFEPHKVAVNGFCLAQPGTGLFFVPTESPTIHTFFIPSIGPAPKFCSFLDNIVEQLQEKEKSREDTDLYDNFKFLTRTEMDTIGISSFIGTPMSRPYMHGFLVEINNYKRALQKAKKVTCSVQEPDNRETEPDEIERCVAPSVNEHLFTALNRQKSRTSAVLKDPRFVELFADEEFAIENGDVQDRAIHRPVSSSSEEEEEVEDGNVSEEPLRRKFHFCEYKDATDANQTKRGAETMESSLRRLSMANSSILSENVGDEFGEKSLTFIPAKKGRRSEKAEESKRQFRIRKKESNLRPARHIIRNLSNQKI